MKTRIALLGLLASAVSPVCSQERITEFMLRPMVEVRSPLQGDSTDFSGKRFGPERLLKSLPAWDARTQEATRVAADTAGYVAFRKAEGTNALYSFSTRMRAERFMKGKLRITTPARFELFVNGVSSYTKTTAEDSLSAAAAATVPLRLEPQADYEIGIRLLAADGDKAEPKLRCEFEKDEEFKDGVCHVAPDLKGRFSLANTVCGSRVSRVTLSPDGKYMLVAYTDNFTPKRSRSHVEVVEVKTGRVVMPDAGARMRWMPEGSTLYTTVTGEHGNDIVTVDMATMTRKVLLRDVPEGRFAWSPKGDCLIYSMTDDGEKVDGPLKRIIHPDDRIPGSRGRGYLMRYDVKSGLSERLTYGGAGVALNDISPDGSRLLCTVSKSVLTKCPYSATAVFEIDLATLHTDTVVGWDPYVNMAAYSPDGRQIVVIGSPAAFGGIGKNCGSHPVANDFDTQAFVMDLASRKVQPITRDFDPTVELLTWNRADGCIYFKTVDRDCENIYRYVPKSGKMEKMELEEDVIAAFDVADDNAAVMAYVGGGNAGVGAAYLYDAGKRRSKLIADPMREQLDRLELADITPWSFTASDGTVIDGMACLPPGFDPAKKYPLIVYYYGGTLPSTRGMTSPYSPQVFASRDYVVYVVQPSGTIGYGQEFSARHVNAWGKRTADDIIEGTRKFCEEHPFVDATKIGCLGASYGGFMTMYLQTQTDMFAAAASHAGISNVTSYWGEGYWGYSYNSVAAANSYPWSDPELFTKQGALFNADKISTPLLLLHGTADTNVPIGESIQLYNALKILGKPVEFVTVDGEDHFIMDYDKRVQWQNTIMAWFARWLQDSPQWWNDMYPEKNW